MHPVILPQNGTYPALTVQLISDPRGITHSGIDGLVEARYQITAWGITDLSASALADEVRAGLHGRTGAMGAVAVSNIRHAGGSAQYEPDVGPAGSAGLYSYPVDYLIQYAE